MSTGIRIANEYSGADIGAKINAADASFGAIPGVIVVLPGNYTMKTQVVLSPDRTLRLPMGKVTWAGAPNAAHYGAFILNDRNNMVGEGWGSIIVENSAAGQYAKPIIVTHKAWNHGTYTPDADGNTDIRLADFQIQKGSCPDFDDVTSTINLGNAHRAIVERLLLFYTSTIGIEIGGGSNSGYSSSDAWVRECMFVHVGAQNLAAVNSTRFHFVENIFVAAGQVGGKQSTMLDLEPNIGTDVMSEFEVSGNVFFCDSTGLAGPAGNAILVQKGGAAFVGPGVIANNVVYGSRFADVPPTDDVSNGIILAGGRDVIISGNTVRRASQIGIYMDDCIRCKASGNLLTQCGGGGNPAMRVGGTYNTVSDNHLAFYSGLNSGSASNNIVEVGASDHNVICNNEIGVLYSIPGSVELVGASSREFGNSCDGVKFRSLVIDGPIVAQTLVKPGTIAGSVAQFTTADSYKDALGVYLGRSINGVVAPVALLGSGQAVACKSDGSGTIPIGAAVQPSTTSDGRVMSGSTNQLGHNLGAAVAATPDALCGVL